jgi:DNA-binding MarR family transcriptional regulator
MKQKFISIPSEIFNDTVLKKMIPSDMMVYMYLCSKGAHGKPIYINRVSMCRELGNVSISRVSASLKRLTSNGHINRSKLNGATSTELLTFVKDRNNIFIRGMQGK